MRSNGSSILYDDMENIGEGTYGIVYRAKLL